MRRIVSRRGILGKVFVAEDLTMHGILAIVKQGGLYDAMRRNEMCVCEKSRLTWNKEEEGDAESVDVSNK